MSVCVCVIDEKTYTLPRMCTVKGFLFFCLLLENVKYHPHQTLSEIPNLMDIVFYHSLQVVVLLVLLLLAYFKGFPPFLIETLICTHMYATFKHVYEKKRVIFLSTPLHTHHNHSLPVSRQLIIS